MFEGPPIASVEGGKIKVIDGLVAQAVRAPH